MSKRNELVAELKEMGINAEATDVMKNGVVCEGIMIPDGSNVNAVMYPNEETTAQEVIEVINNANKKSINEEEIMREEYVRNRVKIGMMRSSAGDRVIRKPSEFDGIDMFLYVDGDGFAYKLPANYPYDMWKFAEQNTKADTVFVGMSEILFGMDMGNDMLYVLTNKSKYRGAGCIIDKDTIRNKGIGNKFYAIPSSIHEWILMPYSDDFTPENIREIIGAVNTEQVDPEEQLGDHAYILEV